MRKPKAEPFSEAKFYSPSEERNLRLAEIANLSDREGYLWFKSLTDEAFKVRTAFLSLPNEEQLQTDLKAPLADSNFGRRISRRAYEQLIQERDSKQEENKASRAPTMPDFEEVYRRRRG